MSKKKGKKTLFNVQEATQLILMDSDSDEGEIDLGDSCDDDSAKDSDWEAHEEDVDSQSEVEEEDLSSPRAAKGQQLGNS